MTTNIVITIMTITQLLEDLAAPSDHYYHIHVRYGIGHKKCYLGTPTNTMLHSPDITTGNLSRKRKAFILQIVILVIWQTQWTGS